MKNLILLFVLLLSFSLTGNAATITISNTCTPPMGTPVTGSMNCSVLLSSGGYPPGASVSASAALTLASNSSMFSNLSAQSSVYANGFEGFPVLQWYPASALSLVALNATLITAGAPRSGYIQLNVTGAGGYGAGYEEGGGALSLANPANGFSFGTSCSIFDCPFPNYASQSVFPFELGVAFPISYSARLLADSFNIVDGPSAANIQLNYSFRFVEADGITPVVVAETPEPGTLFLFAVPALLLAFVRQRPKALNQ